MYRGGFCLSGTALRNMSVKSSRFTMEVSRTQPEQTRPCCWYVLVVAAILFSLGSGRRLLPREGCLVK